MSECNKYDFWGYPCKDGKSREELGKIYNAIHSGEWFKSKEDCEEMDKLINRFLEKQRQNPDKEYEVSYKHGERVMTTKAPKMVKIPEGELDELIEEMNVFRCAYENVMLPRIANRGSRIYAIVQQLKGYKE